MMLTDRKIIALPLRTHETIPQKATGSCIPAAVYNFSERQQAEKTQQWLTMIVESSNDAIIGISLEGTILSWNQAAKRLFGYSTIMVIGHPIAMLFLPEDADEVQLLIARSGRGELIDSHEMECIHENGQRVCVSLALSPVKNKNGSIVGVAIIARDITKRKRAVNRLYQVPVNNNFMELPLSEPFRIGSPALNVNNGTCSMENTRKEMLHAANTDVYHIINKEINAQEISP